MFTPSDYEDLKEKAYKAYQIQWMISHGFDLSDAFNALVEGMVACFVPDSGDIIASEESLREYAEYGMNEVKWNIGFGDGSIFACKNEFLECEFLDRDYMKMLLGLTPNAKYLLSVYNEYMQEVA